jgi:hypothetical protein
VIIVGDIGRILKREEHSGNPEDAPVLVPDPSQPDHVIPEPEAVPA